MKNEKHTSESESLAFGASFNFSAFSASFLLSLGFWAFSFFSDTGGLEGFLGVTAGSFFLGVFLDFDWGDFFAGEGAGSYNNRRERSNDSHLST